MTATSRPLLRFFAPLLALTALAGCDARQLTAERIAHPAHLYERQAPEGQFVMTTFERVYRPGTEADIYIEGDGKSWVGLHEPSLDPTPTNPVALHLATRDDADNVIYLARPCQYGGGMSDGSACPMDVWTRAEYSPSVIGAENAALDELKARYNLTGFNLIGYSGGGAVAVLLAARRDDVKSIRTVAGNLDPALFASVHGVTPPARNELDPLQAAPQIAHIPQHHFIGAWDKTVPAAIYDHYRAAAGPSTCIRAGIVADADHDSGWVDKWPALLKAPLDCDAAR